MNLSIPYYKTLSFCKHNSASILTGFGVVGVVATAVSVAKATPKALDVLEEQREIVMCNEMRNLSKFEEALCILPSYIPSIALGLATITCIVSSNHISKQKQAMLTSAYAFLNEQYREYRDKVKQIFGDDGEAKVREEIAKDHYTKEQLKEELSDVRLYYDPFSERYFEKSKAEVQQAIYELNRMYALSGEMTLNNFYEFIGLPPVDYGEILGWSGVKDWEINGFAWIDVTTSPMVMSDGLEALVIEFNIDPSDDYSQWAW